MSYGRNNNGNTFCKLRVQIFRYDYIFRRLFSSFKNSFNFGNLPNKRVTRNNKRYSGVRITQTKKVITFRRQFFFL